MSHPWHVMPPRTAEVCRLPSAADLSLKGRRQLAISKNKKVVWFRTSLKINKQQAPSIARFLTKMITHVPGFGRFHARFLGKHGIIRVTCFCEFTAISGSCWLQLLAGWPLLGIILSDMESQVVFFSVVYEANQMVESGIVRCWV